MTNTPQIQMFISCPPGLEAILNSEIKSNHIGLTPQNILQSAQNIGYSGEDKGGVILDGSLVDVYHANLHLRTASRVIVRLGEFYTTTFSELRTKASRMEWEQFLKPGQQVSFSVTCHKSKLYHSTAVAERILGAMNDRFLRIDKKNNECVENKQGQLVLVRIVNDKCTISIDSSGDPLYKRGYKLAVAKAPLRENIAAAMIRFSGWDENTPLIDPFCGSGTIPIEATMNARKCPPGLDRKFQFFSWPCFDKEAWNSKIQYARSKVKQSKISISGFDRDAGAIKMAEENANRWSQNHSIIFSHQALSYLKSPGDHGTIITNPPYGVRIYENTDLRNLYARFGTILTSDFNGWTVVLLTPDDRLTANLALGTPIEEVSFQNGGIPVKMVKFLL